jgi:hypothetical protein
MRRWLPVAALLVTSGACSSSCGSCSKPATVAEAGPAAPSTSASAASASTSASAAPAASGRFFGGCNPKTQAAVCTPDGTAQMSCGLGEWKMVRQCDGPAGCKGSGDDLVCDVKHVTEGEACTGGLNPPRCQGPQVLMQCLKGKWARLVCSPPGTCQEPTPDMPASCR